MGNRRRMWGMIESYGGGSRLQGGRTQRGSQTGGGGGAKGTVMGTCTTRRRKVVATGVNGCHEKRRHGKTAGG